MVVRPVASAMALTAAPSVSSAAASLRLTSQIWTAWMPYKSTWKGTTIAVSATWPMADERPGGGGIAIT